MWPARYPAQVAQDYSEAKWSLAGVRVTVRDDVSEA